MKVRAMRVRARAGQRRMVARHKWHRALDDFAAATAIAHLDAMRRQANAVQRFLIDTFRELVIRPVVAQVVDAVLPNAGAASGATSSRFAARNWSSP